MLTERTLSDTLSASPVGRSDAIRNDEPSMRAIWVSIVIVLLIYVTVFLLGVRFFVLKTMVLPIILAYGLMVRQRAEFVMDWLPLLSATVLFDAVRGAIWVAIIRGYQNFHLDYVIALEQAVFGTPALSLPFQTIRTPSLDLAAVIVHGSHFMYFLFFGLVLWHAHRDHFRLFRRALVLLMVFGLVCYAVIPTAPPWVASLHYGMFAEVPHVSEGIYTLFATELYGTLATNPVAAMPSLHVAFPVLCALIGWRAYGWRMGVGFSFYALIAALVSVYLGEHYAVDAIAGALVAWLALAVGERVTSLSLTFRNSLLASGAAFTTGVLILSFFDRIPPVTY
jgi:hypothetical protein